MEKTHIEKFENTIPKKERGKLVGELVFRFYENGMVMLKDPALTNEMLISAMSSLPTKAGMRLN